ncbi:LOW QUALITY PROTEIN: hypothetical protein Dda_6520 [Drechslerella dactyloides]|uniref:Nitronate monooxygenase domain-containing protein n=1 Tax=Drechslerella dactyloides TaxID=74499 RepID=A0AAD6ITY2_DREDA|nr:LOW QUALITY PROTEIN: hypothetical protein Dda_6520 [Drechslerella dactyloides]
MSKFFSCYENFADHAALPAIATPITKLFGIKHPVLLAGMNVAAGPKLAAAVSNAGGLGVIGGVGYSPEMLREQIQELKSFLAKPDLPFGVDLLLPQVGGSARKTNYDYTKGKLEELVDIVIAEKASLFVSAVGVPPRFVVDKLHKAGIPYMKLVRPESLGKHGLNGTSSMIGHPKHVQKCIDAGCDIICAQGGEGGVPTSVLIPTVVDICKGKKSPLTGQDVLVVAAGGIFNGKGLAAVLAMGASAAWVGTRFILAEEAGAPKAHQEAVITSGYDDNVRTIIFTGRPLRVRKNPYIMNWEENRKDEITKLTAKGVIPVEYDIEQLDKEDKLDDDTMDAARPFLMGKVAAVCNEIKPAKAIVEEMVSEAIQQIQKSSSMVAKL